MLPRWDGTSQPSSDRSSSSSHSACVTTQQHRRDGGPQSGTTDRYPDLLENVSAQVWACRPHARSPYSSVGSKHCLPLLCAAWLPSKWREDRRGYTNGRARRQEATVLPCAGCRIPALLQRRRMTPPPLKPIPSWL